MRVPLATKKTGFTLAEAAVTIALVAVTLTILLQSLQSSTLMAAHTRDQKIARELALGTLAQVEAGMWQDELDFTRSGNYDEEDFPDFWWELSIGDEAFSDAPDADPDAPFDNWAHRRELELDRMSDAELDEEEEEATKPFEKVRIKVTFPSYREYKNDITIERWIPWEQVYGEEEEDPDEGAGAPPSTTGSTNPGGNAGGRDG